jgi:hypothetical protein
MYSKSCGNILASFSKHSIIGAGLKLPIASGIAFTQSTKAFTIEARINIAIMGEIRG